MVMPGEAGSHNRGPRRLHHDSMLRDQLRCTSDELDDGTIKTLQPILYEQTQKVRDRYLMLLGGIVQLIVCIL
jgi:hypothetical protein